VNRSLSLRWLVVVVSFSALSLSFSLRSTLGLMTPYWTAEIGWSRSLLSTGGAVALLVMAVTAPIAGNLVDRSGPSGPLVGGMTLMAIAAALLSTMADRWQFILAFSVVGAFGFGLVAMHVVVTAVAPLFDANRGLATGVATAGATAGQLLVIPLFTAILTETGWRSAYIGLALISASIAVLLWLLLPTRAKPEANARKRDLATPQTQRLLSLLRSPVFHALFWSFTLCGFTTAGVIETHLLPFAAACGYPPLASAAAYGVLSTTNLVGIIFSGYLADRTNGVRLLAMIYFLRASSFILLMNIVDNLSMLFIFSIAFGLFDYSTVPVTANLVASRLGIKIMGLAMGALAAGHALGAAVAAYLGGYLFDLFMRYSELWGISIALSALAGLITLTIPEERKRRMDELAPNHQPNHPWPQRHIDPDHVA
jgi:MFS family permease